MPAVLSLLALLALLAELWCSRFMATITIRNLDEKVKRALQVRAALNGRSMEAEAREVLSKLAQESPLHNTRGADLGTAIHERFAAIRGVDLQIPPRQFSERAVEVSEEDLQKDGVREVGLGTAIRNLFAPLGGVELQIPARRKSHRQIPTFDE
jgi:plasmid stability protein